MGDMQAQTGDGGMGPRRFAEAVMRCLRFHSRLPAPRLPFETDPHAAPDFRVDPVALPVAALLIALPAVLALALAVWLRLDPLLAAALAVAALAVATGAMHEDGLADTADGLWGGATRERRLEIMRDSRIGAYGAVAAMLSLLLRVAALAAILKTGGLDAALGALAIAAMISRVEAVRLLAVLPPARADGASAAVGRPGVGVAVASIALALVMAAALAILCRLPLLGLLLALALSAASVSLLIGTARRHLGGQTGDVAGAAQQLSEIALYLGLAIALAR